MSDPHEPSDWFDRSVYDDVEDEARSHWMHERPPRHRIEDELDPQELAEYYEQRRSRP